jgi:glycine cleavage system H lipoate-binding protein
MSAILAFLTALVLIAFGWKRANRGREVPTPVLVKRYVHPGHGWIRETEDGYVLVGMDDFAQSVIGSVHDVTLPGLLKRVRQGEPAWEVWHGGRLLPMVSPVSGWVVEKNEMVIQNPSLINSAPYGDGWLFKVKPYSLGRQTSNLLTGKPVVQWIQGIQEQLARVFSTTPAFTMQDGGVLVDNLAERCSDEEWQTVVREFFHTDTATNR